MLRAAGLRLTRQRVQLAGLLFRKRHRHVTAEELHLEAQNAGYRISLATVYNTLHQFREADLLREVVVMTGPSYFDTNTSDHHHFFHEDTGDLKDIPQDAVEVARIPEPPAGTAVSTVDIIVRVSSTTPPSDS